MVSAPRAALLVLIFLAWLTCDATAQCTNHWLPGAGVPGVNGRVAAVANWDPDGPGPLGTRVVFGGEFTVAGDQPANRIAVYDPVTATWTTLGSGMDAGVTGLLVLPNGELIAAGAFTIAGGVPTAHIARWTGSGWQPLGTGLVHTQGSLLIQVPALVRLASGDLVVGGNFDIAGGLNANSIARWNGSAWSPLGSGILPGGSVNAIAVLANGDLAVSGYFSIGGVATNQLARWNGVSWQPIGGAPNGPVNALATQSTGALVAGGSFSAMGTVPARSVARWDGSRWSQLGAGLDHFVHSLAVLPSDQIWAGGLFSSGWPLSVARFDGVAWQPAGTANEGPGPTRVFGLAVHPGGELLVGGDLGLLGDPRAVNVARWDGSLWRALNPGTDNRAVELKALRGGDVLAVGDFTAIGSLRANRIARFDGVTWRALGSGMDATVNAALELANGEIVAGGAFASAGGVPANRIALWEGNRHWRALGSGLDGSVLALAELPSGGTIAGGDFTRAGTATVNNIALWDGAAWRALGTGLNGPVRALAVLNNGDVIAGGYFISAGGVPVNALARWNGTTWSSFGRATFELSPGAVEVLAGPVDGSLFAGGYFNRIDGVPMRAVARWNGVTWQPVGGGVAAIVSALALLPDGDVVAAGSANFLARWNGGAWTPLAALPDAGVDALAFSTRGELFAAGSFTRFGNTVSSYLARLGTSCPASSGGIATNCVGPAGPLVLAADTLPFLGGTYRSTSRGFAQNAVAVAVLGLTNPRLPLPALHPIGLPNCELLASLEIVLPSVPSANGVVSVSLAVPNLPALIGTTLFEQHLQLELNGQVARSLSSSNGLRLTLGAF